MKRKATLLIQHLETIYTMMPPRYACVHHGFIAFYHEHILCVGEGEGWQYVDKDTRIIEGCNHIAVPGFIDVSIHIQSFESPLSNTILKLREQGEIRMKNGTLVGNLERLLSKNEGKAFEYLQVPYEFDYVNVPLQKKYPIVYPLQKQRMKAYQRFCISGGGNTTIECLDQLLCAKLYYQATSIDAMHILASCTIYPARCLHLPELGSIAKDKIGNVLLMEGMCFEDVLTKFHGINSLQVIKEGTRILPNIII